MDKIDKKWLVNVLRKCGAIKYGDFILTSGKRSSYYVDIKAAITRPDLLRIIARGMAPHAAGYARIAGVALGAVPIAVAVSFETDLPYIMVRKERREHGTQKPFEGELVKGEKVLFVEDVVTTGGTLVSAIVDLRERGVSIDRVVCVVDRQEGGQESLSGIGVSLYSLLTAKDLMSAV